MTTERVIRPEFTGSAGEYFRIWIVNLFFTLATLGVYSAWAKVRKKRYFYGSTRFDGDSFDYFGSAKAILKGRLLAFAVFVAYAFFTELYPGTRVFFWIAGLLALPWLALRALSFNARNSAWRGLRFDFNATPRESARVFFGMALLVPLSAGLAFPWFMARQRTFVASHHRYGNAGFVCEPLLARSFYGIYLRAGLLFLAVLVPGGIGAGLITLLPGLTWLAATAGSVVFYAAYAVALAYAQARTTNIVWSNITGPGMRFECALSAKELAKLYIGNVVAMVCSAGLLIPWAVVRTLRYRLASLTLVAVNEEPFLANPALPVVGATGQEMGEIFNLDLGL